MNTLSKSAALVAALIAVLAGRPASAVDRTLGASVPKPTASGAPWSDAQVAALAANIDVTLAGAATLRGAHIGLYAIDARDGHVLYERNADDAFQPASSLKLLVGSAALERLGPDYRFRTTLLANGPIENGARTCGAGGRNAIPAATPAAWRATDDVPAVAVVD